MGDLGLGKSFHMMTQEKNRWIPDLLETSMEEVGPTSPIPWLAPILHRLPKAGQGARQWLEFVGSQVQERMKKKPEGHDVSTKFFSVMFYAVINLTRHLDPIPPGTGIR